MIKTIKILTISIVVLLVAVSTINAQATGFPTLEIVTPTELTPVPGNTIPVLFNVENFEIVDFNENPNPVTGQGHIHVWLDDENPTAESAIKLTEDVHTFSDVPFGEHILMAELVTNTHQSLTPPQEVTVNFTNEPFATPEANVTSGFDKNTALVIFVVVALVIIAAWWYTKDEEDEDATEEDEKPKKKKTTKKRKTKKKKKS